MLDFNADKVVTNGIGNLDINVMDFIRSLYGVEFGQYVNNGIEVDYQFEHGTVHLWGTAWFDIVDEDDFYDDDDVSDEFGEYVTDKLCNMNDLNLDLDILFKKLSYDGQVYVELVEDRVRCEAVIEED